ncbi:hypothetical protein ANCCAN_23814 [Ancylostoma caninum]|uniref:Uncharacterized protein n=1 Tax=Ancylostoma caninum TaxID=29170 RepID=A0A368FDZ5_ANCCA|nr:hypothetical protein ANCCAN_23814 [Ancylostoma caninum]
MSSYDFLFNLQLQQFVQQLYTTNLLLAQNPADFYRQHDPLPALPFQVDQLRPGLYSAPHPPPHQLDNPPPPLAPVVQDIDVPAPSLAQAVQDIAPVQLFRGEKEELGDAAYFNIQRGSVDKTPSFIGALDVDTRTENLLQCT